MSVSAAQRSSLHFVPGLRPQSRCTRWRGRPCRDFPTSRGILPSRSPLAAQRTTRCGASAAMGHKKMVFPSVDASRDVTVSQWGGRFGRRRGFGEQGGVWSE
ncbi:hypothetical protein FKM82_031096 [Ascaphus truei]